MVGAPEGNKNAEIWTYEESLKLFVELLNIAEDKTNEDNDFIGEVAQQKKVTLSTLDYLKKKYPKLEGIYSQIKSNCEANCFRNGKKGKIISSLAIMNLKSNHGWTDRVSNDITSKGESINKPDLTKLTDNELRALAEIQSKSGTGKT